MFSAPAGMAVSRFQEGGVRNEIGRPRATAARSITPRGPGKGVSLCTGVCGASADAFADYALAVPAGQKRDQQWCICRPPASGLVEQRYVDCVKQVALVVEDGVGAARVESMPRKMR